MTQLRRGDRFAHPQKGRGTVITAGGGVVSARFDDGTVRDFVDTHPGVRQLAASDEGRISPAWAEINDPGRFIPPLTVGERRLAEYLDQILPPDWTIYVRPHLDADRPLIAALHPAAGGMFWDVVDWDLTRFRVEGTLWVGEGPIEGRFASPFRFLNDVRTRVYGVYAPEIGEAINDEVRRFGVLKAGLFFCNASTAEARRLASMDRFAHGIETFGRDGLDPDDPQKVVQILGRQGVLENGWFESLDRALNHARRLPDPLATIALNKEQTSLAVPREGYTGIEGVAGSGKTIVLAHRAALSAEDGRRALILTFNRTLTNYVRGMLHLVPVAYDPGNVTVLHFHELCRRIHDHYREPLPPVRRAATEPATVSLEDDATDQVALESGWPASAKRLLQAYGVPAALRFDAVLIDEAQDFSPQWFELIQALGAPEVVLAYDAAQRLYERQAAMTRGEIARLFGGKTGRVSRLGKAMRLSMSTIEVATRFAERWSLQTLPLAPADDGLLALDAGVSTVTAGSPSLASASVLSILRTWQAEPNYRARDVAVVVPDKAIGEALVRLLAEQQVSTNHVFAVSRTGALMESPISDGDDPPWRISQAHKTAFAFGDARLKVSTVHSFKGCEAGRVIFMLPFRAATKQTAGLVYVGLTRSRGALVLVGRVGDYGLDAGAGLVDLPLETDSQVATRFGELMSEASAPRVARRRESERRTSQDGGQDDLWPPGWADWAPTDN
jgi:UvrD-like helicase C-terminal domain